MKTLHTLEEKFGLSCREVFSSSCRKVTSDAGTVVATVAVNVSDYNKCGTFMNAASKPPPLAYISWEGGEVFTGGGRKHLGRDTLGPIRPAALRLLTAASTIALLSRQAIARQVRIGERRESN